MMSDFQNLINTYVSDVYTSLPTNCNVMPLLQCAPVFFFSVRIHDSSYIVGIEENFIHAFYPKVSLV